MSTTRRHFVLGAGAAALSGCTPPSVVSFPDTLAQNPRDILVVTNRAVAPDPAQVFSEIRSDEVFFRDYTISVPASRAPGEFAFPKHRLDPDKQFFVAGQREFGAAPEVLAHLRRRVAALPRAERGVFVIVHGFGVSYPGAVFRAAQIATDFKVKQPTVLFSWPSAGRLDRYAYDRDSVLFSRGAFARGLQTLARHVDAPITILAHSMGGLLTMEALKRLALWNDSKTLGQLEAVILAQPDVDLDVFRTQMQDLSRYQPPVAVIGSRRDRALRVSSILTGGHPRVGSAENIEALRQMGVLFIDVTDTPEVSVLGHSKFTRSPALLSIIASGALSERIVAGAPGQDILIDGLNLTGQAALAVAYLPYTVGGTLTGGL